jgi:hypothetical protein
LLQIVPAPSNPVPNNFSFPTLLSPLISLSSPLSRLLALLSSPRPSLLSSLSSPLLSLLSSPFSPPPSPRPSLLSLLSSPFSLFSALLSLLSSPLSPLLSSCRITRESSEMRALLVYIIGTEKLISNELRSLSEMKVFPAQELLLIRKDLKAFKEKISSTSTNARVDHEGNETSEGRVNLGVGEQGSSCNNNNNNSSNILEQDFKSSLSNCISEQILAERKLSLLSERRKQEQEARITQAKKMARIRAAQKTQSKDPSSFANQNRF